MNDRQWRARSAPLVVALLLATVGCVPQTRLESAPDAREVGGRGEAAVELFGGVRVVARADAWPGHESVDWHTTPIRVEIENDSEHPLAVRYENFSLVSAQGDRYNALPPFGVIAEEAGYTRVPGWDPISPAFVWDRFAVAPYLAPYYLGPPLVYDPFYLDHRFYDSYSSYWDPVPLPTVEMLERALPEGVLEPGGRLAGFLYFENLPADLDRVTFRGRLDDAESDRVFGEVWIPFEVVTDEGPG